MKKVLNCCIEILMIIAAALTGISTVLATVNALFRKMAGASFPWAEELTTYMIVIAVFLAIPFLEWHGKQLTVDLLSNSLKKPRALKAVQVLGAVIVVAMSIIVVIYGFQAADAAFLANSKTYILQWPKGILYSIGVFGFVFAIISTIAAVFVRKDRKGGSHDS